MAVVLPSPLPPKRSLVLLATTTKEKLVQYQAIARAKHLPIEFHSIYEISPYFHVAPEDAHDTDANAAQKMDEIKLIIDECKKPDSAIRKLLETKCAQWGCSSNPSDIHFATDDHTFRVPKPIWTLLKPKLTAYVDSDLLRSADKDETEAGPGAETGPILSAVGVTRFFNLFREAALEAGYNKSPIPLTNQITLMVDRLDNPVNAPIIPVKANTQMFLCAPQGLNTPFVDPAAAIITADHFMHTRDKPSPAADNYPDYLVNDSCRARAVDTLAAKVLKLKTNGRVVPQAAEDAPVLYDKPVKAGITIGLPTIKTTQDATFAELSKRHISTMLPDKVYHGDTARNVGQYDHLSLEGMMRDSDALLFTPFDPASDAATKQANYLALFSAKVAKQLIARDMSKPVVIMDVNGCWKEAVDLGSHLANSGMTKDFMQGEAYEGAKRIVNMNGISHYANSYYDVVSGEDADRVRKAAMQVLNYRLQNYEKPVTPTTESTLVSGGELPPEDMFKVAVFLSASSDNRRLLADMEKLGEDLAENKFGLVWGGGDRHGMGAVYKGYKRYQDIHPGTSTWMGAFSTEPILKTETEHGRFPAGVNYWEQNSDIYQRMAHMIHKDDKIHSDAIVIAPGGDGTVQEWLAAMVLKHEMPEIMKDKAIIIYSPDLHNGNGHHTAPANGNGKSNGNGKVGASPKTSCPFWQQSVKTLMGEKFLSRIESDHKTYAKEGYYLATNEEELKTLLVELREQKTLSWRQRAVDTIAQRRVSPYLP